VWYVDEQRQDQQVRWITVEEPGYIRPVRRLSMHWLIIGALRLVRVVLGIGGLVEFDQDGATTRIVLNKVAPQVSYLAEAFRSLLRPQQIIVGVEQI
jgi:hypothetical protein